MTIHSYQETIVGRNGVASLLQTIVQSDGPAAVIIESDSSNAAEFLLSVKKHDDTYAEAPSLDLAVAAQAQVCNVMPDGAQLIFQGVARGAALQHPAIVTATDGATSVAATRRLTSAGSTYLTSGVRVGDVVLMNENAGAGGNDDGVYRVTSVVSENILVIDRNWPAGAGAAMDFTIHKRCCVAPYSFRMALTVGALAVLVTDNGSGVLSGTLAAGPPAIVATGTINYFTGDWAITCGAGGAPDGASAVTLTYAEALPCVQGGKISFPIKNLRRINPCGFYGIGNGANVKAQVSVAIG